MGRAVQGLNESVSVKRQEDFKRLAWIFRAHAKVYARKSSGGRSKKIKRYQAKTTVGTVAVLESTRFVSNDLVTLNDGGDADPMVDSVPTIIYPHDFAARANQDFRPACDFGWEHHRKIQFGAGVQPVIKNKIYSPGRDVARLTCVKHCLVLNCYTNADWQRQIVTACRATFCHSLVLPPKFHSAHTDGLNP